MIGKYDGVEAEVNSIPLESLRKASEYPGVNYASSVLIRNYGGYSPTFLTSTHADYVSFYTLRAESGLPAGVEIRGKKHNGAITSWSASDDIPLEQMVTAQADNTISSSENQQWFVFKVDIRAYSFIKIRILEEYILSYLDVFVHPSIMTSHLYCSPSATIGGIKTAFDNAGWYTLSSRDSDFSVIYGNSNMIKEEPTIDSSIYAHQDIIINPQDYGIFAYAEIDENNDFGSGNQGVGGVQIFNVTEDIDINMYEDFVSGVAPSDAAIYLKLNATGDLSELVDRMYIEYGEGAYIKFNMRGYAPIPLGRNIKTATKVNSTYYSGNS